MEEAGPKRRGELRPDWRLSGARPADAPCLEEAAGRRMWRRKSHGGRGGGGGGRSGGGVGVTGRTGSASQQLFAVTT